AGCEATDRIASGELPALAIDCSGSGPNRQQYRGKNVLGNQVIADMAQILYTLYALSSEGQEKLAWDLIGDDLADLPTAHMHQQVEAIRAKGIQPIAVTVSWWRAHPGIDKDNAELAKLVARQ